VRNPTQHQIGVKIDYFVAGARTAIDSEFVCLARRQTLTRNLRNLGNLSDPTLLQGTSGHAGVTPVPLINCPLPDPAPALSGDFIHVDSSALAGALPLVSTDTARLPPELCRRWSTRFLNDSSSAASTDFLFFVPGNNAGAGPVAVGKVYTEDGQFVQEVAVSSQEEAFRRTTRDDPANQIPLLAKFGSIEWELPPGVVGNIAAVHRAGGQYEVAVPGTCVGSASALVVPYFQVEPSGTTTLFAVRNESGVPVSAHYDCFSSGNPNPSCHGDLSLGAHATHTVNLRIVVTPPASGYVRVEADSPDPQAPVRLSGDFVRVDLAAGRAVGGALVDTDPQRMPRQLCSRWSVRFLSGSAGTTKFVFYLESGSGGKVAGKVYGEDGNPVSDVPDVTVSVPSAFELDVAALPSPGGSIEWDLGGLQGNVAAVFKTADGLSVLVPGVCVP